jgi:hypothetical protein
VVVDHRPLVLDGRHEVERAVKPPAVVEHLDEHEVGPTNLCLRLPALAVDELGLEGGKPAFPNSVDPALALSWQALGPAVVGAELAEVGRGVLVAAVGVEDAVRTRSSIATWRVSQTSEASLWSAIDQPTTRRYARSMTLAKYIQPSQGQM